MAGGLPRDLIHPARDVVSLVPTTEEQGLSEICATVVGEDIATKARASLIASRAIAPAPARDLLMGWLNDAATRRWTADNLKEWLATPHRSPPRRPGRRPGQSRGSHPPPAFR
jgi:hypothetical protein